VPQYAIKNLMKPFLLWENIDARSMRCSFGQKEKRDRAIQAIPAILYGEQRGP
jgi:hypothetical protein